VFRASSYILALYRAAYAIDHYKKQPQNKRAELRPEVEVCNRRCAASLKPHLDWVLFEVLDPFYSIVLIPALLQ